MHHLYQFALLFCTLVLQRPVWMEVDSTWRKRLATLNKQKYSSSQHSLFIEITKPFSCRVDFFNNTEISRWYFKSFCSHTALRTITTCRRSRCAGARQSAGLTPCLWSSYTAYTSLRGRPAVKSCCLQSPPACETTSDTLASRSLWIRTIIYSGLQLSEFHSSESLLETRKLCKVVT